MGDVLPAIGEHAARKFSAITQVTQTAEECWREIRYKRRCARPQPLKSHLFHGCNGVTMRLQGKSEIKIGLKIQRIENILARCKTLQVFAFCAVCIGRQFLVSGCEVALLGPILRKEVG